MLSAMKNARKAPANPKVQPDKMEVPKTRRRAVIRDRMRAFRTLGEKSGFAFAFAMARTARQRRGAGALALSGDATRAEIRLTAARGRKIAKGRVETDMKRRAAIDAARQRRSRAILAQEARRRGLSSATADEFDWRRVGLAQIARR